MSKPSPFKKALKVKGLSDILDEPIQGSGRWMTAGQYLVSIEDNDIRTLDKGYIKLTLVNNDKERHRETVFIFSKDGEISIWFARVIASVIPNRDAIEKFESILADDELCEEALQCIRGMKAWIEIEDGPGYRIQNVDGIYESYDVHSNYSIAEGKTYQAVEKQTEMLGYEKSYRRISKWEAGDEQIQRYNISAFNSAYQSLIDSKTAESDSYGPNVHRFKGVDSK